MSRVDYCVNGIQHTELNGQDIEIENEIDQEEQENKNIEQLQNKVSFLALIFT